MLISFPNVSVFGLQEDNRVGMIPTVGHVADSERGRFRAVGSEVPIWVIEGAVQGVQGGGTCLKCGQIVTFGIGGGLLEFDFEEETASATSTGDTRVDQEAGPGTVFSSGKHVRRRGWGRYGSARMRGRRRRQILTCVCRPLRLSDDIPSCSCLNGHHPRGADRTSADGYTDNMHELELGGGFSGDGSDGLMGRTDGSDGFPPTQIDADRNARAGPMWGDERKIDDVSAGVWLYVVHLILPLLSGLWSLPYP